MSQNKLCKVYKLKNVAKCDIIAFGNIFYAKNLKFQVKGDDHTNGTNMEIFKTTNLDMEGC